MESFRIQRTSRGRIALARQGGTVDPAGSKRRGGAPDDLEPLSRIIEALNERFGLQLGPEHRVALEQIRSALDGDAGLDASARVNTRENVRLTFDPKVEDKIQEIVEDPRIQVEPALEPEGRPQGRQARHARRAQDHRRIPQHGGRRPPDRRRRRPHGARHRPRPPGQRRQVPAPPRPSRAQRPRRPRRHLHRSEDADRRRPGRLPRELRAQSRARVPALEGSGKGRSRRFYARNGPGTVRLGAEDAARYVATRFGASLRRTD